MGNHFRKPEDAQGVAPEYTPDVAAAHFATSDIAADAAPTQEPVQPVAAASQPDPFAYNPDLDVDVPAPSAPAVNPLAAGIPAIDADSAAAGDATPAQDAPAIPQVPDLAAIPDPLAPAAPQVPDVRMAPEVSADQAEEVADLDAALSSPDFTTVFAPQAESRRQQAREAGVEPVILLEHVTKVYPAQPNKPALDDVNLEVYPGEFVFLVGHSGSGKTTLLRTMTRDVKPTSGRILIAGQDLMRIKNRKVPFFRRQIGTVFQDYKLLPGKTAYENVAFALQCIGKPKGVIRSQVPEVLRLVGLADQMDSLPDQLSGGEQQRVAVARAMVNRPPLLICDEPTGNLDPAISLGIMKLLERINRTGTTVIVATHDREMVDSMHRRVIALEAGHVVRDQERGGYGNYGA